jgi:hypothetical protein
LQEVVATISHVRSLNRMDVFVFACVGMHVCVDMHASKPVCKEIIVRITKSGHVQALGHVAKLDRDKESV